MRTYSFQLLFSLLADVQVGVEGSFDPLAEPGGIHVGCCVARLEMERMEKQKPWEKAGDKMWTKLPRACRGKRGGGKKCGRAVTTCLRVVSAKAALFRRRCCHVCKGDVKQIAGTQERCVCVCVGVYEALQGGQKDLVGAAHAHSRDR
jgi:hypothetical protein